MIYLITGTPGSGKSLFTIEELSKETTRPVYYYKLRLTDEGKAALPNWSPITKEQLQEWQAFEDGAIFFVDEAHTIFPQRSASKAVPDYIEALAEHRHRGMDFYIIDQHPRDVDIFIRRRTYKHWHWINVFGYNSSSKLEWQGFEDGQPDDYHAKQKAGKSRRRFPKKVYNWYISSTIHTKKKTLPWQLVAIPVLLLMVGLLIWFGLSSLFSPTSKDSPAQAADPVANPASVPSSAPVLPPTPPAPASQNVLGDPRFYNTPPYLIEAVNVWLDGSWSYGSDSAGAHYIFELSDGSLLPLDSLGLIQTGARISVINSACIHAISWGSHRVFTRCKVRPDDDQLDSDSSQPAPFEKQELKTDRDNPITNALF